MAPPQLAMADNDPAPADRAPRPPSYAAVITGIALVCSLVIGLDAWRTWTARGTEIAAGQTETANLTRSLAQHANEMLATADTLLVSLRASVEGDSVLLFEREHLRRLIASQIATAPMMRDLMWFDANGDRILNAGTPAPAIENISDRAYFQYHAANPDRGAHLGDPIHGKLDGTWIITLSRRIDSPGGDFAGVVAATFAIGTIRQFYETFDVGGQGFIRLNTTDGVIVTRYPTRNAETGQTISSGIDINERVPAVPVGDWHAVSPVDAVERFGSYRKVESYPLVVAVGRGVDELLAPWRTDALIHVAISLCTSTIIALLGMHFTRQLHLRCQAEKDLRRRKRQYRLLADNNTDLIVQLDCNLRHVYASPASQRLLDCAPHQLIGAHLRNFVHADDWPALAANLLAAGQTETAVPISYRLCRDDGCEVWVEASGHRLAGDEGYVLAQRDITERRRAELQLRQAQRMEAVGQLTAGVAHDFNNLLQGQTGALELLLAEVAGQSRAVRLATMALERASHAAQLTHSLLSFSRQQFLEPEAVAIPALLTRLATILRRTLGPRISIQFDVDPDVCPAFADPAQVESALLNLTLNARDAMPDGGRLCIQAGNADETRDLPDHLQPGRYVTITVSDDGCGMSPATLAQACEPFFTTKRSGQASGLGLSMVQGFARQSGGALCFRSEIGHGTQAELWLPVAAVPIVALPTSNTVWAYGSGRVLLVEDVMDVLVMLTEMLEGAGLEVVAATSGEDALERISADQSFTVLVTDFAMPGIDGGELTRRAREIHPSLPVIIITGYAETEKLVGLPPDVAVLRKPVSGNVLASRIHGLLAPPSRPQRVPLAGYA